MSFFNHFRHQWTPAQLSSTILWLDGADSATITESSGSVSQWNDKGPIGNNVTQGTGANQPTTGTDFQNGLNTIAFDGADQLDVSYTDAFTNLMGLAVIRYNTGTGNFAVCCQLTDGSDDFQLRYAEEASQESQLLTDGSAGGPFFATTDNDDLPIDEFHIQEGWFDSSNAYTKVDGNAEETSADPGTVDIDDIAIGRSVAGFNGLIGAIGELIIAETSTTADLQILEGYLAWKWGLVSYLPAAHPYKNNPPYA